MDRRVATALLLTVAVAACGARSGLLYPADRAAPDAELDAAPGDATLLDGAVDDALADAPGDAAKTCPTLASPVDLGIVETITSSGATCKKPVIDPPCTGLCDNGKIDACPAASEDCDGALGGTTCTSLGYVGGGPMICVECRFDRGACMDVVDATLVTSSTLYQRLGAAGFSISARPDRIAVASYAQGASGYGADAQLHMIALDGAHVLPIPCLPSVEVLGIDVVAVGANWLIAVDTTAGIEIFAFDNSGAPLGARRLAGAHNPRFASRPESGPLLGFEIGEAQWAALLDADGSVLWTTKVFDTTYTYTVYDAVFVGDAFLLAKRLEWQDGGVHVARLELDGRLTCVSAPSDSNTEYPQIAWDGTRGRLTWSDFSNAQDVKHAFIDANGVASSTTSLGVEHFNPAPVIASGAGSLVLLGNDTGGVYLSTELSLARLDGAGAVQASGVFVRNPGSITGHRMAIIDGQRAALGWLRHVANWGVADGVEIAVVQR